MSALPKTIQAPKVTSTKVEAPAIYLPADVVAQAIAGHNLKTFQGWTAAVNALLDKLPAEAAMLDGHCLVYRTAGYLWEVFANENGTLDLELDENGWPVDCGACEIEAFSGESGCWDSHCDNPEAGRAFVTNPVFVLMNPIPQ